MGKYINKYRKQPTRLANWDNRWVDAYFITICTTDKMSFFGILVNGEMRLNKTRKMAQQYCMAISAHFAFVPLGNMVIMPNFVHSILIVDKSTLPPIDVYVDGLVAALQCNAATSIINYKTPATTTNPSKNKHRSKISPKPGSISTIVRSCKSVVTKNSRKIEADFKWQSRFHHLIIPNAKSFKIIQNYIKENPLNWDEDKL